MTLDLALRRASVAARDSRTDWRLALAAPYRGWRSVALAGAITGGFAGSALQLPLLLLLGLDPGLAWLVSLVPSLGAAAQPLFPRLLGATGGRLRLVTVVAYGLTETRGLPIAAVVALHALGVVPAALPLVVIAALGAMAGFVGQFSGTGQRIWTWVVLPEGERRRVTPRIGTMGAAASAGVLWMASGLLGAGAGTGLWIYAACFAVGGAGALLGIRGLLALPRPGAVRPQAAKPATVATSAAFRNLATASGLAATGAGLQPAIPLVALAVIHLPASFTVTLGALGSTVALLGSTVAASIVAGRSASRMLRATHVARFGELLLIVAAILRPEAAALPLLAAALLEAGTSSVNGIASSETLYRLSGEAIVANQGRFSAVTQTAFTASSFLAATIITAHGGAAGFLVLLTASAACRLGAARILRVSPSWRE